jgi:hypothetical protein
MPKRAPKVLHVAKGWRNFGVRNKAGERVIQRKEEMCFIAMDDVDAHCPGAWHDQEHRYWAGIAASGRSECRKCGTKVPQGALRIGLPRVRCSAPSVSPVPATPELQTVSNSWPVRRSNGRLGGIDLLAWYGAEAGQRNGGLHRDLAPPGVLPRRGPVGYRAGAAGLL